MLRERIPDEYIRFTLVSEKSYSEVLVYVLSTIVFILYYSSGERIAMFKKTNLASCILNETAYGRAPHRYITVN